MGNLLELVHVPSRLKLFHSLLDAVLVSDDGVPGILDEHLPCAFLGRGPLVQSSMDFQRCRPLLGSSSAGVLLDELRIHVGDVLLLELVDGESWMTTRRFERHVG